MIYLTYALIGLCTPKHSQVHQEEVVVPELFENEFENTFETKIRDPHDDSTPIGNSELKVAINSFR